MRSPGNLVIRIKPTSPARLGAGQVSHPVNIVNGEDPDDAFRERASGGMQEMGVASPHRHANVVKSLS